MHSFESKTHSFIIKFWLEETTPDAGRMKWRGHITHVPDGKRCYLESVDDIPSIISPYLGQATAKIKLSRRFRQWLSISRQGSNK